MKAISKTWITRYLCILFASRERHRLYIILTRNTPHDRLCLPLLVFFGSFEFSSCNQWLLLCKFFGFFQDIQLQTLCLQITPVINNLIQPRSTLKLVFTRHCYLSLRYLADLCVTVTIITLNLTTTNLLCPTVYSDLVKKNDMRFPNLLARWSSLLPGSTNPLSFN